MPQACEPLIARIDPGLDSDDFDNLSQLCETLDGRNLMHIAMGSGGSEVQPMIPTAPSHDGDPSTNLMSSSHRVRPHTIAAGC